MKVLIGGPWVGEFGWEVATFQAHLRAITKRNRFDEIIVFSRTPMEYLYSDFCTKFIPFDPPGINTSTWNLHDGYNFNFPPDVMALITQHETTLIGPGNYSTAEREFIVYGKQLNYKMYDVVFHARSTPKTGDGFKNWPLEKWNTLAKQVLSRGLKCCSIGTTDGAFYVEGTEDKRNISLEDLATLLRNSRLIVGPSSGPMHYAALCLCPQLVWVPEGYSAFGSANKRYKIDWNPFHVDVVLITEYGWQPPVDVIYNNILKYLKVGV
jgi:ADP-heptose:LPS heptosyltransferase